MPAAAAVAAAAAGPDKKQHVPWVTQGDLIMVYIYLEYQIGLIHKRPCPHLKFAKSVNLLKSLVKSFCFLHQYKKLFMDQRLWSCNQIVPINLHYAPGMAHILE